MLSQVAPSLLRCRTTTTSSLSKSLPRFYSASTNPAVLLERNSDGISYITLQKQETRNALSRQTLKEFNEALRELRYDNSTRAVIVKSSVPRVFCAGADLQERKTMSQSQVALFLDDLNQTFSDLERLPMPTIACIEGAALGGGLEMGLCCDFRISNTSVTKIGLPETSLAIIPGAGGTQRLPRLIGPGKAKDLIFTARIIDANEALQMGILNQVADVEKGQSATELAVNMANQIMKNGPIGVRAAKLAVNRGLDVDLQTGIGVERQAYGTTLHTKDRLEALTAFAEKRKPNFKGE